MGDREDCKEGRREDLDAYLVANAVSSMLFCFMTDTRRQQADKQTNKQTNEQTGGQTDRQADGWTNKQVEHRAFDQRFEGD